MVTKVKASVLADTSVTPGTYGGASQHAVITIDAQGRASFAGNVLPSISTTLLTGTINAQQVANNQLYGINITGNAGTATTAGSAPASDVYAWAKAAVKPSYTKAEVGLGNVDNTADANKSVNYANSAGSAGSATNAIGSGQSWTNPSRSTSVTYTNTTGKPIMVVVSGYYMDLYVDGVHTGYGAGNAQYSTSAIVPNGSSYYATGTVSVWAELR
jgi:hypothetical protein